MRINGTTLPAGVETVRLQALWLAAADDGMTIPRNPMDAALPFVGEEVYDSCAARIRAIDATAGLAGSAPTGEC